MAGPGVIAYDQGGVAQQRYELPDGRFAGEVEDGDLGDVGESLHEGDF